MAKAILLSIRPNWVKMILSKEKTFEIRKSFPKDYVGWVYIYATKGKKDHYLQEYKWQDNYPWKPDTEKGTCFRYSWIKSNDPVLNGKVVARFWCDKVLTLTHHKESIMEYWDYQNYPHLTYTTVKANIGLHELNKYAKGKTELLAIPITKLEIFENAKELSDFKQTKKRYWFDKQVRKAPQNFLFVDIE